MSLNSRYTILGKGDLWIRHDKEEVVVEIKGKDLKGKTKKAMYR